MPLTDKVIKQAQPDARPYRMGDMQGLYLEVVPRGSKYWRFKYRFMGKEKKLAFGVYPEVSLPEAREMRDKARKLLAQGIDPSFAKKEERRLAELNAATTFKSVALEWHTRNKDKWSANYVVEILHRLEKDIFPSIGHRPIADISAPEFLSVLRLIEKRGANEVARRMLQINNQIFRYAIVTGRAKYNPATDMRGALNPIKRKHFAAIESKDIPEFLKKLELNEARLFIQTRHAIKLLMLTFVRTSELINAKWTEFDLDAAMWVIPAERMKMRRPHMVPLSRLSLSILKDMKELNGRREFVFASQAHPRSAMSNGTILSALGRMGYKNRMTGHGFRALAMSTIKEDLGYRHEVVDRQLAHAPANKVDAAYDRAMFLNERKKMMQEWADYLDKSSSTGKVIRVEFAQAAE